MTQAQIQLVQQSFGQLVPSGDEALEVMFGEIFYQRLRNLQLNVIGADITRKAQQLLNVLRLIIGHLELPAPFLVQHNTHSNFKTSAVASALHWTLEMTLGEDFKAELKEAWLSANPFLSQFIVTNWFE
jgi:hypothetical protein